MSAPYCCIHFDASQRLDEPDFCRSFECLISLLDCGPLCPGFASAHAVTERVSDAGFVLGADAGDEKGTP